MTTDRVEESRRRVEESLDEVRHAVERELGVLPRAVGYVLPLAALSVGMLVARKVFGRRRLGD